METPRRYRASLPEEIKGETLHLRLKDGLKADATTVLAAAGISLPEAIRVVLGRVVSEGKLPFELEVPNATTRRRKRGSSAAVSKGSERFEGSSKHSAGSWRPATGS